MFFIDVCQQNVVNLLKSKANKGGCDSISFMHSSSNSQVTIKKTFLSDFI